MTHVIDATDSVNRAGVLFDLDGVLIDSEDLQYRAYSAVLEPFGVTVTRPEYGREFIGNGNGPEYVVKRYSLAITPEELRRQKTPVYTALLRAEITLMPGVVECVERLAQCFPLAVATNSTHEETDFVLQRFGLTRFFKAIVTRESYARPKPAPDAFVTAANHIGLPPARCVVIEDAYKGIAAAHEAGCRSIAVPNEFTRENDFRLATRMANSLDDVSPNMIEEVLER